MKQPEQEANRPSVAQIKKEIKRREITKESRSAIWGAIRTLMIFAAAAVLVSTLWLPVIQVQQSSMTPTLRNGELLIFITTGAINRGDVIAFHYSDQVLIKRVIGLAGD